MNFSTRTGLITFISVFFMLLIGGNSLAIEIQASPTTNTTTPKNHQYNPAHVVVFKTKQCQERKIIKGVTHFKGKQLHCKKKIDFKAHHILNLGLINRSAPGYVFFKESQCKFSRIWRRVNLVECKKTLLNQNLQDPLRGKVKEKPSRITNTTKKNFGAWIRYANCLQMQRRGLKIACHKPKFIPGVTIQLPPDECGNRRWITPDGIIMSTKIFCPALITRK